MELSKSSPDPSVNFSEYKQRIDRNLKIMVLIAMVFVVVSGFIGYYLGSRFNESALVSSQPMKVEIAAPNIMPDITDHAESLLGETQISYLKIGDEFFLKRSTILYDNKVDLPNTKARSEVRFFSNLAFEEVLDTGVVEEDSPQWVDILQVPVLDYKDSTSIHIDDYILSFKQVPNSSHFIFSVDFTRVFSVEEVPTSWNPYESHRVLYIYDIETRKLAEIADFDWINNEYSYPKINEFSPDSKYAQISLFGCVACGGHYPELLLVNLQNLQTKNIGKVLNFEWGSNGSYTYKDYIVSDCTELGPGPCNIDPDTLPLKSGRF